MSLSSSAAASAAAAAAAAAITTTTIRNFYKVFWGENSKIRSSKREIVIFGLIT